MTALEAWLLVEQEGWATDARPGNRLECKGGLTADGYCKEWRGLMGSVEKNEVAGFRVKRDKNVVVQAGFRDPSILANAFSIVLTAKISFLVVLGLHQEIKNNS